MEALFDNMELTLSAVVLSLAISKTIASRGIIFKQNYAGEYARFIISELPNIIQILTSATLLGVFIAEPKYRFIIVFLLSLLLNTYLSYKFNDFDREYLSRVHGLETKRGTRVVGEPSLGVLHFAYGFPVCLSLSLLVIWIIRTSIRTSE